MFGIISEIWNFLLIVSPWLLLGLFIAGLIHSFIGESFIKEHLGGSGFIPVLKATLFGIPLPVCSCSIIPIAAGLRKDGASKAATMSFLISTPTTGVDSIFITYGMLGGVFAIARPLAALIGGILIGVIVYLTEKNNQTRLIVEHKKHPHLSLLDRIKSTFVYGFSVLPQDLSKTLLLGIAVGGALSALLPTDFASEYLSNPLIAYPLMIVVSVPIYICAVGSVPIAAALLMKGLIPGAALAFMIAGPATNTITMGFVGKKLGKKVFIIYLVSIIIIAVGGGLLMDLFLPTWSGHELMHRHDETSVFLKIISTVLLLAIMGYSLFSKQKKIKEVDMEYRFYVPDMTCKHCQMTIKNSLKKLPGIENVVISLTDKTVSVDGEADPNTIIKQIEGVGYTVGKG
ncbi:MAG: permease [Candidatus Marinimicrobia bacterium]|nr:permease [Candidatus Neomarinimicrobiota bacterium]